MQDILPEGAVIRKLWVGEADKYRDHMLRLDPESRHSRFGGGVSDDFIRSYVDLSISLDTVVHGFFLNGVMRGAAELRPLGLQLPQQAEAAFSVEKPWQSRDGVGSGAAAPHVAHRPQPRLSYAAYGVPCREPAHAAAGSQIRRPAIVRFRRRRRRSRVVAANAALDDARSDGRQPRLRDGDARSAIPHAESISRGDISEDLPLEAPV